jgi:hypothetical protein
MCRFVSRLRELIMRVLYRYAGTHIPEDYLQEIEAAGFELTDVATVGEKDISA